MSPDERDEQLVRAYEKATGRKPVTRFPDDPDWQYRGTKKEREELEARLGLGEEPVVIEGQEELPL